ncbi:MAG: PAS domain S-box protein [Abditibacteriales bacterium]|nr:PAS domain S-box protein [Abditibacteriales bacterium]
MEPIRSPSLDWLHHLPIGGVVVDRAGLIRDCNQKACVVLGAASAPVGEPLARFFAEAERERLSHLITAEAAEPAAEVFTRQEADGSQRFVEVNAAPLTDVGEADVLVLLRDVTTSLRAAAEQQRLVEALQQREKLYQQAMSAIHAVPYLKDYSTNSYPFMGEGILQMTGYTAEEMTPDLWDSITGDTVMLGEAAGLSVTEAMQKALTGELRYWHSEGRLTTRDGQTRWVSDCSVEIFDERGQSIGSIGVLMDITARKEAEEALNRRLAYLQTLYRLIDALNRAETAEAIYQEALNAVQNALPVDRAAVLLLDPDGVMRFKAWRGISDAYRRAVEGHSPWSPDEKNPQPIFISDVAAEESLGPLREIILGEGIRAMGFIPLVSQERLVGKFMLYCDTPRRCDMESAQLVQAIAHHVAFAIERQRATEALQYRVAFERLIASLSNYFINLPMDEMDSGIQHALQAIGEFIGADRSYVFLYAEDGVTMDNTHEWCAEGIEPQIDNLKGLRIGNFPWSMEKIQRLETVNIPRVADLPPAASPEKAILEAQDIQSLVLVPLVWKQTAIGFVGFDAVRTPRIWSEDSIALLQMVGEMIVNGLARRRAEVRLRQAEEKYRSIFENAVEGIFQSTPDGRILTANPALARIWGYDSPEELITTLTDVEHQLYVNPAQRATLKRLIEEHNVVRGFEFQVKRKDGSIAWMLENVRAVRDASGVVLYYEGTIEDITARKRMERRSAAFAELGRRLSAAATAVEAARIIVEVADELIGWDACFVSLYSAEQGKLYPLLAMDIVEGQRVSVDAGPEGKALDPVIRRTIVEGGQLILRDTPSSPPTDLTPFGDVTRRSLSLMFVPMRNGTRVIGVLSIQSYTPHAYDAAALDTLQALADHCGGALDRLFTTQSYQALVNSIDGIVFEVDAQTYQFTFVSPQAERILGYPVERWFNEPDFWANHIHPDDREEAVAFCVRSTQEKRDHDFEYRMIAADGRVVWIHDLVTVVIENDQPVKLRGLMVDITAHKQMEETLQDTNRRLEETLAELRATQQQLVQQERLRALGAMASGIAHDFNNALAPILGFSELLMLDPKRLEEPERVLEYLRTIHTAAQDAANVVSRLREFYRFRDTADVLLSVDLNGLVEQTILLTQPKWKDQAQASGRTIAIQTDLQPVPLIAANESELREALINLIFNAVDAMPNGGEIVLRTRMEEVGKLGNWGTGKLGNWGIEESKTDSISQSPRFPISPLPHFPIYSYVVLEISDTGVGMTEEVRRRCLEPFFSTKGERGSGLGLAVVYGIVQRHNGTIEIDSAPGEGTTVRLRLPAQGRPIQQDRPPMTERVSRPLRVLVVDDEPRVREVIVEYLQRDGHIVVTAANGREGLEKFQNGQFDLVITDRAMTAMSGDQLALALKQFDASVPVILLTGFGEFMGAAGEHPPGVDVVASKPIGLTALREAMAKAMRDAPGGRRSSGAHGSAGASPS